MKPNPITDIESMMTHYNFQQKDLTSERLNFRFELLQEEIDELATARLNKDADECVDALIDIVVIALGTLHLSGVNVAQAWSAVHQANMGKLRGAKPGRPSDGWDLYKPEGWTAPSHINNTGNLNSLFKGENK